MNTLLLPLTQSLLPILTFKLNKYLINIINEYNIIDFEKLITYRPKEYEENLYSLNKDLTIEDIIIKTYHKGCCGFFVSKSYMFLIDDIDEKIAVSSILRNDKIIKRETNDSFQFWIKDDTRILPVYDIINLDNVIFKTIRYEKF